jgi:hypothetical protein
MAYNGSSIKEVFGEGNLGEASGTIQFTVFSSTELHIFVKLFLEAYAIELFPAQGILAFPQRKGRNAPDKNRHRN